jgi:protein-tyrosine phosphatase
MNQFPPHLLWIGHAGDGRDYRRQLEVGIGAIVQLAIEEPPLEPPRGLVYFRFPLCDGADNPDGLLELAVGALAALIRRRVPTLVCCGAGMSRSPAVSAAAVGLVTGEPIEEALKRVLTARPGDVSPALWEQLKRVGYHSRTSQLR